VTTPKRPESHGLVAPEIFEAHVGNGYAGYFTVELQPDGWLAWVLGGGPEPEGPIIMRPSPGNWQAFRLALDDADVWSWAPDGYKDDSVADGDYWGVTIEWDGRCLRSFGANAHPAGYMAFTRAVSRLAGGRTFR
jgi:hypothetical protein